MYFPDLFMLRVIVAIWLKSSIISLAKFKMSAFADDDSVSNIEFCLSVNMIDFGLNPEFKIIFSCGSLVTIAC